MNFYVVLLFSASVFIPGILGLVRFPKVESNYYPFFYFIWIGCINEVISFIMIMSRKSNYISSNTYVFLASLFIAWFFRNHGVFKNRPAAFYAALAALLTLWLVESFWIINITEQIGTYFRIFFSFLTILMSIQLMNTILVFGSGQLVRNALFLISLSFILYFTFKTLVEAFWIYGLQSSESFQLLVWNISVFVNLFTNLIYAVAILWIPKKQPSILLC
jgi:hypothetical protein